MITKRLVIILIIIFLFASIAAAENRQSKYLLSLWGYNSSKATAFIKKVQKQFRLSQTGKIDGATLFYLKYITVTNRLGISKEDIYFLAQVITAEAGNQPYHGQVGVGAVIVNRWKDARFPNGIKQIVYAKNQFSVLPKLSHTRPTILAYSAALDALLGYDPTGGAKYFYNPFISTDNWITKLKAVRQIGEHRFCIN